jgi:hypothetical protein
MKVALFKFLHFDHMKKRTAAIYKRVSIRVLTMIVPIINSDVRIKPVFFCRAMEIHVFTSLKSTVIKTLNT